MEYAKIGVWIAFGCLCVLAFVFMPVALASMFDPELEKAYIGLCLTCAIYLVLYFIVRFLIYLYPWWKGKNKATKISIAVVSVILVIAMTTVSIVVPQNNRYVKFTNHFETTWNIDIPDRAKLKYSQGRSYGFVGGHDELAYAVFKLDRDSVSTDLKSCLNNHIKPFVSCYDSDIKNLRKAFPSLHEKEYARLYFEKVLQDFHFKVPKRFLPDWKNENILWGLYGGRVTNYNKAETDACIFAIFLPNTKQLILFDYLEAGH